jgi:hypothetical protein
MQGEDAEGVVRAGLDDEPDGEDEEDEDLESAQDRARLRAHLDSPVIERGDQDRPDDHEDDPGGGERPAELAMGDRAHQVADEDHGDRPEQRLDERVSPADKEPERRVDRLGRIGVDASGAWQVLGQLPDRRRHQQARDQGEQDGQRQRAAGIGGTGRDRQRDRACRGHGGDRLEQDLSQSDGSVG